MKRKILGLFLVMTLVFAYAVPASAAAKVSDDADVQAAYEQYLAMDAALDSHDYDAMVTALEKLGDISDDLTEAQAEEWSSIVDNEIGMEAFLETVFMAGSVAYSAEAWEAYKEDPGVATAKEFTDAYEEAKELGAPVDEMVPGIAEAYAAALADGPSDNVVKVYDAYDELLTVFLWAMYDEDFIAAYEGFEAVQDTFNALTEEELNELADLIGAEDAAEASALVSAAWTDANVIKQLGEAQAAFEANPGEETAKAYVELYESIFSNDNNFTKEDIELFEAFFSDDAYIEAKELLNPDVNDGGEGEAIPGGEGGSSSAPSETPKTGDDFNLYGLIAVMAAAAAAGAMALRRKAQ